ncbi:trigger factor [Campylobacter corcagiensis]|uniref:Trigger factor n=1 Tax=Campylobacter corcagiensis TaxID=1448857 RepID=A0A7M1LJ00_9BACT|nr:trigger factor [Campylobacter corcagiensis]QKF63980.1 trigger factor (peptidyl-prolyl cis /trans isomerase, chaperone) [Campylobacter corcagiensis]QOQ87816.1 trigger factor [Campylobacter corcagiensis]
MEVKAKLVDSANALVDVKIAKDAIDKKVDEIAKKSAKQVKMAGFRPGKVPVSVVKKRYAKELESDAKQDIFKEAINDGLKELDKKGEDILGEPTFAKLDDNENGIDASIEISFRPEIDTKGYEESIPEYSTPKVMKKEIEEKINELLLMIAPLEKSDKEVLEKGDFAKFDFEGFVDGEAFEGGKAENYSLEIGSNQFIPGFEDGMVGLKVGEEKDIKVTFPAEYGAEHLAGKDAIFKVKLHEIQSKNPAKELNDETLKKLMPGDENITIAKFEDRVKEQIRADKFTKLLNEELKPKFVDAVVEKLKFDLPKNIVEQEMDLQFRNSWNDFTKEDMEKFREDKDALANKREEFRPEAEKSVKLTFIVDELAKQRNVEVADQEVLQAVYMEAFQYGIDPKKHLESYKNQGILPAVKMALIEEKLFKDLFSKDKKEDKKETKEDSKGE